jgi:hypothetical protein
MDEAHYCAEAFSPITGRSGSRAQNRTIPSSLLGGCHVIQRERPQPFLGMSRPASPGLRAVAGRS